MYLIVEFTSFSDIQLLLEDLLGVDFFELVLEYFFLEVFLEFFFVDLGVFDMIFFVIFLTFEPLVVVCYVALDYCSVDVRLSAPS